MPFQYEIVELLAETSQSSTFKIKRSSNDQYYILKQYKIDHLTQSNIEKALQEAQKLQKIQHPSLIKYEECYIEDSLNIIMEFIQEGNLATKLAFNIRSRTVIQESRVWNILYELIEITRTLHQKHINCLNFHDNNVFIKDGHIIIDAFNICKYRKKQFNLKKLYYASPEIWTQQIFTNKTDVWSIGCLVYQICMLRLPFQGQDIQQLLKQVCSCLYMPIQGYSYQITYLIQLLLQDQKSRPSCTQILEDINFHGNFKNINNSLLHQTITDNNFELYSTIQWTKSAGEATQSNDSGKTIADRPREPIQIKPRQNRLMNNQGQRKKQQSALTRDYQTIQEEPYTPQIQLLSIQSDQVKCRSQNAQKSRFQNYDTKSKSIDYCSPLSKRDGSESTKHPKMQLRYPNQQQYVNVANKSLQIKKQDTKLSYAQDLLSNFNKTSTTPLDGQRAQKSHSLNETRDGSQGYQIQTDSNYKRMQQTPNSQSSRSQTQKFAQLKFLSPYSTQKAQSEYLNYFKFQKPLDKVLKVLSNRKNSEYNIISVTFRVVNKISRNKQIISDRNSERKISLKKQASKSVNSQVDQQNDQLKQIIVRTSNLVTSYQKKEKEWKDREQMFELKIADLEKKLLYRK